LFSTRCKLIVGEIVFGYHGSLDFAVDQTSITILPWPFGFAKICPFLWRACQARWEVEPRVDARGQSERPELEKPSMLKENAVAGTPVGNAKAMRCGRTIGLTMSSNRSAPFVPV
jgi:hypothetical protein